MIYNAWGSKKNVPKRTRISDIAIFVGVFWPRNVGFARSKHTKSAWSMSH